MAYRRSQLIVYESKYPVDSINQKESNQGYYKLSCGRIGGSKIRKHSMRDGNFQRLWMV